ncbi:hypothetical protein [Rhizobium sp. P28RR-XV]|uniref:hypothetical protein n=1 Tax=Rhizobium sp. P28RR-XV TaxID=2726737 RepID=UPI001456E0FC|nr:hypothetical protein [Rhizobium sp. P28RR-XV]NLR88644.1 hypothetical protein [Rhizobium sp. P28RR-XV]
MQAQIATDHIPDWTTRKNEAHVKLERLRRERGVALLDGKPFDNRMITLAEAELDAIEAAEVEAERRHREDHRAAVEARMAALRAQMEETLDRRSKAIIEAELATYKLASAIEVLLSTSKETTRIALALGHHAPMMLDDYAVRLRAGLRVAAILGPVCGKSLGKISIPDARGPILSDGTKLIDSWHDSDAEKIGFEIARILNPKETTQ